MEMAQRRTTRIRMTTTDISKQLLLQTWMSAAFPTGAFTCSHGLEAAISDERIHDAASCLAWLEGIIRFGSGWNDAVLTAATWSCVDRHVSENANPGNTRLSGLKNPMQMIDASTVTFDLKSQLTYINDLAIALCAGAERLKETTQLGATFFKSASTCVNSDMASTPWLDGDMSLPVAVGICGALASIPQDELLASSLQANSSNLIWIATRLVPLGQTDALQTITALSPLIESTARDAAQSTLDDLGNGALLAELSSLEHEQLTSRICIT